MYVSVQTYTFFPTHTHSLCFSTFFKKEKKEIFGKFFVLSTDAKDVAADELVHDLKQVFSYLTLGQLIY